MFESSFHCNAAQPTQQLPDAKKNAFVMMECRRSRMGGSVTLLLWCFGVTIFGFVGFVYVSHEFTDDAAPMEAAAHRFLGTPLGWGNCTDTLQRLAKCDMERHAAHSQVDLLKKMLVESTSQALHRGEPVQHEGAATKNPGSDTGKGVNAVVDSATQRSSSGGIAVKISISDSSDSQSSAGSSDEAAFNSETISGLESGLEGEFTISERLPEMMHAARRNAADLSQDLHTLAMELQKKTATITVLQAKIVKLEAKVDNGAQSAIGQAIAVSESGSGELSNIGCQQVAALCSSRVDATVAKWEEGLDLILSRQPKHDWDMVNFFHWVVPWVPCYNSQRLGGAALFGDGGKYMCGDVAEDDPCLVYSLGSNMDFSWELAILAKYPHCEIHTFDHTIESTNEELSRDTPLLVNFHRWGLGPVNESLLITDARPFNKRAPIAEKGTTASLHDMMRVLGHENREITLLKVDVEGAEWSHFPRVWDSCKPESERNQTQGLPQIKIKQMMVEMHYVLPRISNLDNLDAWMTGAAGCGLRVWNKERQCALHGGALNVELALAQESVLKQDIFSHDCAPVLQSLGCAATT